MASILRPLPCDAELLSAYRDDALEPGLRRLVELHARNCSTCAQELREFERLAVGLRLLPVDPVPPRLAADVAARIAGNAGPTRRRIPTHLWLGVSMAAAIVLALLFQRAPARPTTLFEAFPAPGSSDVSTETAITITFIQPVDQDRFQQTIRLEPPVPFNVVWETPRRAAVVPLVPLAPAATYAVVADAPAAPGAAAPAARTLTVFRTAAGAGAPPVVDRADYLPRPGSRSSAVSSVAPVVASTTDVGPVVAERGAQPSNPGTTMASATTASASAAKPPGTVAMLATSTVRSSSTAATRRSSSVASSTTAAASSGVSTTAAASARSGSTGRATSATSSTVATASVARRASAALTGTSGTPHCSNDLRGTLAQAYADRPELTRDLGCARAAARAVTVAAQVFQSGILITLVPDQVLYQLRVNGAWHSLGLAPSEADGATAGPASIGQAFAGYWSTHPDARAALGLPISPQESSIGIVQAFTSGLMLNTPGWVYVIYDGGRWERSVDRWSDALPDPGDAGDGAVPGASFTPLRPHRLTAGATPSPTATIVGPATGAPAARLTSTSAAAATAAPQPSATAQISTTTGSVSTARAAFSATSSASATTAGTPAGAGPPATATGTR